MAMSTYYTNAYHAPLSTTQLLQGQYYAFASKDDCKKKFGGKCDKECKDSSSSKCKDCEKACGGSSSTGTGNGNGNGSKDKEEEDKEDKDKEEETPATPTPTTPTPTVPEAAPDPAAACNCEELKKESEKKGKEEEKKSKFAYISSAAYYSPYQRPMRRRHSIYAPRLIA